MTCHSVDCGEPHTSIINEIAQAIEESQYSPSTNTHVRHNKEQNLQVVVLSSLAQLPGLHVVELARFACSIQIEMKCSRNGDCGRQGLL